MSSSGPPNMAKNDVVRNIAQMSIILTLPLLLLTTVLVAFVLKYSVGSDVQVPQDAAFYVHVDSTMLIFVASWMSSLAPCLTASAVYLSTYHFARRLVSDSQCGGQLQSLTPSQLQLALDIIHGSTWSGLCTWVRSKVGWREHSNRSGAALNSLSFTALVAMLLGLSVFAADTWLHVATTSIQAPQRSVVDLTRNLYSLALRPDCLLTNNSFSAINTTGTSCTLNPSRNSFPPTMYGGTAALLTLNNMSNNLSVANNGPNADFHFLKIANLNSSAQDGYTARTYAVSTACTPISKSCDLKINETVTFNCSHGGFAGASTDLTDSGLISQCLRSPDISNEDRGMYNGVGNPFYMVGASLNTVDDGVMNPKIKADPEAVTFGNVLAAIHLCNISVYDVEYDTMNGQFTRFASTLSNSSVANAFMAPLCATTFGWYNSKLALNLATQLATDFQDFSSRLAGAISSNIAAAGVGALQLAPAISIQRHENIVVARVPKAPFFLLISLDLVFVVLGIVLTVLAALTSQDARKVQFRFTIAGLVAALFHASNAECKNSTAECRCAECQVKSERSRIGVSKSPEFVFHGMTVVDEKREFPSLYVTSIPGETLTCSTEKNAESTRRLSDDWR